MTSYVNCRARSKQLLTVRNVTKSYGRFVALHKMKFDLQAGEVHVLFGENGAGKSTLIKIISGATCPDTGTIKVNGQAISFRSVNDARARGIATMFQEFSLAPNLTVEENIFLGAEPAVGIWLKCRERRRLARKVLASFEFDLDIKCEVISLTRAQAQMVEMIKALMASPRILILDEPTASLSQRETEVMFSLIKRLKADGIGIVYITHKMKDIAQIGDRVTVMKDGQYVDTVEVQQSDDQRLVKLMTGRTLDTLYPKIEHNPGPVSLEVCNLTTASGAVCRCSIKICKGEIVGVAGLVGCGKSRMARALFGLDSIAKGAIFVRGVQINNPTPRKMLDLGVTYVTSDRHKEGLMLNRPTKENLTLSSLSLQTLSFKGWLKLNNERWFAKTLGKRMSVTPLDLNQLVAFYSGGNQQKIMIGKSIARCSEILIFDEPTVGIDVGARIEVYKLLKELAKSGVAILIISSDTPEVLNMSHRLYVVRDGTVVDEMMKSEINQTRVLRGFFGSETTSSLNRRPEGASV